MNYEMTTTTLVKTTCSVPGSRGYRPVAECQNMLDFTAARDDGSGSM